MTKTKCAVRGLVQPNALCGNLIVGGSLCAYKGSCQHQQSQSAVTKSLEQSAMNR